MWAGDCTPPFHFTVSSAYVVMLSCDRSDIVEDYILRASFLLL